MFGRFASKVCQVGLRRRKSRGLSKRKLAGDSSLYWKKKRESRKPALPRWLTWSIRRPGECRIEGLDAPVQYPCSEQTKKAECWHLRQRSQADSQRHSRHIQDWDGSGSYKPRLSVPAAAAL